jgi:hypothetical protein
MFKQLMNFFSDLRADVRDGFTDYFGAGGSSRYPDDGSSSASEPVWGSLSSGYAFNIGSAPMMGDTGFDLNGNVFGSTDDGIGSSDWMSGDFSSGPVVNIDGTPMMGDSGIDMHGNAFGCTSNDIGSSDFSMDTSWDNGCSSSGMFDSSSCGSFSSFD